MDAVVTAHDHRRPGRLTRRAAITLMGTLVLTGCADADIGSPAHGHSPGGEAFNAEDVMFLQMMVPHHRQGITIARLARNRPVRSQVRLLARAIESTQDSEIRTMAGWLRRWGQPASAHPDAHADHGGRPGTDPAAIASVADVPDRQFERAFLNLLLAHQDDAAQTARREVRHGRDRATVQMARRIVQSRHAQIAQMLKLLGQDQPG